MDPKGITLTTDRLVLRPFDTGDIAAYQAIRRAPGVTRFLPSHTDDLAESDQRAAATVEAFAALWDDPGYGPWAVVRDGTLIGHLGLRLLPEFHGQTELLYLLAPEAQGQGLATEGCRAALDWGFSHLGLERIVALALPENAASLAVMERLGMRREPELSEAFGLKVVLCTLDAVDWPAPR